MEPFTLRSIQRRIPVIKRNAEDLPSENWTLLTKVETSCVRILIAGGANVEAE